jgi:hypothetical protein
MKNFYLILAIVVCSTPYSCGDKRNYKESSNFSIKDIPIREVLEGEVLETLEIFRPKRIYIQDSLLFTIEMSNDFFVTCYHFLPEIQSIGNFIELGSGPDEALGVSSIQFVDSLVWVFDRKRSRFFQYSPSQFLQATNISPKKTITLEDETSFDALIVDDIIYTTSYVHRDLRFTVFDMEGKFQGGRGKFPNAGESQSLMERTDSYLPNMALSPNKELFFVAYTQTDLIEIYDKEGNLKIRKQGPDHFFPVREESGNEIGGISTKTVTFKEGKSRDAYFNPIAFNDEIWTMYSGKVFDTSDKDNQRKNKIIVFDWNGTPLIIYTLDKGILAFAVDRERKTIYAITDDPDFYLVKFKYQ